MSFSQEVKKEICKQKMVCDGCLKSMVYGMLVASKGVNNNAISINTESKAIANFLAEALIELTGAIVTVLTPSIREKSKRPIFSVIVDDQNDIKKISELFNLDNKENIDGDYIENDCCLLSLIKGIYCICGAALNPINEYHLEFNLPTETLCDELIYILSSYEFDFKKATRNKGFIAYIKESRQIEDILTLLGAVQSSMELMNTKIEKDLRNKVNRQTNCETANIEKTVNAAISQIKKIEKIRDTVGLDYLPIELKKVAVLRLENPDCSLSELCSIFDEQISRSGINHRLKKICTIADEIV